jgi:tetratricopeptide (TPR) repeat protein
MFSSNAVAPRLACGPAWRPMGRAGHRTERFVPAVAVLVLLLGAPVCILAREEDDWVGKRVVPKNRDFVLLIDDEPVEPSRKAIAIYRVERADGPILWLQAEGQRLSGSAKAEDVIPVEPAVAFFTDHIRAHPKDAFAYSMRAFVREDKCEFDAALHDYDQAIGLEPRNAILYFGRAEVRLALKEDDRAIADFSEAIRLDPKFALAYRGRGTARGQKKDYDKAIEDHSEAIWLDPLCISAYLLRGVEWQSKKENEKAIVDYNVAIRLDPENVVAYSRRALAWTALKKYAKAVADFDRAVQLDSKEPLTYERIAWIRATCPDERFRDGKKAVEAATRACALTAWKHPSCLSTLAAAHAEAGDFISAVKWQTQANGLEPNAENRAGGEAKLTLYREKKPYRDHEP